MHLLTLGGHRTRGAIDLEHRCRRTRGVPAARFIARWGAFTPSVFVLAALALAGACGGTEPRDGHVTLLRLATGVPGATFNPIGSALAGVLAAHIPGVRVDVIETGGSSANVEAIHNGSADLGLAFADVAYMAYVGQPTASARPLDNLRGIAVLSPAPLHVVVRGHSGIASIRDLRGRRVSLGPAGSGTALTATVVLEAHGIPPDALEAESMPFNEAADLLGRGGLDAIFVSAGYPAESVTAATTFGGEILDVSGPQVDVLRSEYPFFRMAVVPAGVYPSHGRVVRTIGVHTLLVCSSWLPEELVHEIAEAFFGALPRLASRIGALRLIDLARAAATPIPLHPGAARYYREQELFR